MPLAHNPAPDPIAVSAFFPAGASSSHQARIGDRTRSQGHWSSLSCARKRMACSCSSDDFWSPAWDTPGCQARAQESPQTNATQAPLLATRRVACNRDSPEEGQQQVPWEAAESLMSPEDVGPTQQEVETLGQAMNAASAQGPTEQEVTPSCQAMTAEGAQLRWIASALRAHPRSSSAAMPLVARVMVSHQLRETFLHNVQA